MRYLFVFLLLGLMVSCGDASGDATKASSFSDFCDSNSELKTKKAAIDGRLPSM